MKMRKILSFVLVLSLVLGSFSMAFAATPSAGLSDIAGNANEDAIQVAYDLGIVTGNPDGTYQPEKAVNRAEFAALITRALGIPESALAGYTTTSFKDTTGYTWAVPYLAFCNSKGIMLGDGQGNAMPSRTINVNEAMTMALRAIGYVGNSADLVGTWPSNYVTKAQDLGLYTDVAATVLVNKATAAQIIYNALPIQKVSVATDGKTSAVADVKLSDGTLITASMLTTGLECDYAKDVVNPGVESSLNLLKYVGQYAEIYSKDNKVVAIKPVGTQLSGKYNATDNTFKVGDTKYTIEDITSSGDAINLLALNGIFKNGVKESKATNTAISTLVGDNNKVTLNVKLSGKTIKEVHSIQYWTVNRAEVISAADLEQIKTKKLLGATFAKDDDSNIDTNAFLLVGVKSLDEIKADNVVYVYHDGTADKKIKKIAVGKEVVTGKITDFVGTDEFYVNGTKYGMVGVPADASSDVPAAGKEVKLFLDADGKVYRCEITSGSTDTYGVIVNNDTTLGETKARVFTSADDSYKNFVVDTDKVSDALADGLIAYGLNKDGEINALDRAVLATSYTSITVSGKVMTVAGNNGDLKASYPISSDVKVFVTNGTTASATKLDKVTTTAIAAANASFIVKDGKVVAMAVAVGFADATTGDDVYGVLDKVVGTVDADDADIAKLYGFIDGTVANGVMTTDDENATTIAHNKKAVQLYKFKYDGDLVSDVATKGADVGDGTVTAAAFANDKMTIEVNGTWNDIAKNVVVYEATKTDGNYTYSLSSVNGIVKGSVVWFYQLDATADDKDDNKGMDVIIFYVN